MMYETDEKIVFDNKISRWIYFKAATDEIADIAAANALFLPTSEVLYKRGIRDKNAVNIFMTSPLSSLLDPFELSDIDKAIARIYSAIENKEEICIYGDYDVDGITATSLLYLFLKELDVAVSYYVPNRLEEGYGLNIVAIEEIASKGVHLIITVDCGISATAPVAAAKAIGVDIIITDHHEPSDDMPKDAYAIIDPITLNNRYPFKNLSGVGVAFKLITALRSFLVRKDYFKTDIPNIKRYLDIVTLGTIADVVPLISENRVIVKHGLSMIHSNSERIGLQELIKVSGITAKEIKVSHVGFTLAPRLNAVGRMGSPDKGIKLLITDDQDEAHKLAIDLENENKYRQSIEKEIMIESFEMIDKNYIGTKSIVLMQNNWHPGVIGIVASRVVDKYFKPTIILSSDGMLAKGSARSIPTFHLYDGLSRLQDIMLSFGGHKYAAGLQINSSDYDSLRERFESLVSSELSDEDMLQETFIDAILDTDDITFALAEELTKLEPFGTGNKEPIFCLKDTVMQSNFSFVGKDSRHLRALFKKDDKTFSTIGFNLDRHKDILSPNRKYDIIFNININEYNGNKNLQLNLKDLRLSV